MLLDIRDLRLVDAVARYESLTKAGLELHVTQSALSHRLADLEDRVGARLFARVGKRMVITQVGEQLRSSASSILTAVARTEDDLRRTVGGRDSLIRLSTGCYTSYHWLPAVMTAFERQFPKVEVRIVPEATRRPIAALLKGRLDLALVGDDVSDRRLERIPLFEDELVAVVPVGHPWASRAYVTAEDFAQEHLIGYALTTAESTLFQEVLVPARVTPRQVSQIPLTEAIVELVKAGLGVAVLANWAIAQQASAGTLATVRVTARGIRRTWSAVIRRSKAAPAHLRAFATLVRREAFPAQGRGPSPPVRQSASPNR